MNKRAGDTLLVIAGAFLMVFVWQTNRRLSAVEAGALLRSQPTQAVSPVAKVTVSAEGIAIGSTSAPVTMVQFTDYQCPFCKRFTHDALPTLVKSYIDEGKLRLVIRDLPLPMHSGAPRLAAAARCAASMTTRNLEFQQVLYDKADSVDVAIAAAGALVGIPEEDMAKCIVRPEVSAAVDADAAVASRLGITGTPTFIVGRTAPTIDGILLRGAKPPASFTAAIDSILKTAGGEE